MPGGPPTPVPSIEGAFEALDDLDCRVRSRIRDANYGEGVPDWHRVWSANLKAFLDFIDQQQATAANRDWARRSYASHLAQLHNTITGEAVGLTQLRGACLDLGEAIQHYESQYLESKHPALQTIRAWQAGTTA
jgi:hypothetical protein